MSLPPVEYGKQADPTKQNALIDKVNEHTTKLGTVQGEIATLEGDIAALHADVDAKPDLCSDPPVDTGKDPEVGSSVAASPCDHKHRAVGSDPPQDVAAAADAGDAPLASREDHVHKGVSKIVAGDNITLDPPEGIGDVTVSSTGGAPAFAAFKEQTVEQVAEVSYTKTLGAYVRSYKCLAIASFSKSFTRTQIGAAYLAGVHAMLKRGAIEGAVYVTMVLHTELATVGQEVSLITNVPGYWSYTEEYHTTETYTDKADAMDGSAAADVSAGGDFYISLWLGVYNYSGSEKTVTGYLQNAKAAAVVLFSDF